MTGPLSDPTRNPTHGTLFFFFFNLLLLAACESVFEEVIVGCNDIIRLMSESKGIVSKTCLRGDLFLSQNNRGRRAEQDVWVFGFVTTKYTPCRGYFQVVKRRDAATLHPIIENVFVWALKCTHDWGAYSNLDQRLHIVATQRVVKCCSSHQQRCKIFLFMNQACRRT